MNKLESTMDNVSNWVESTNNSAKQIIRGTSVIMLFIALLLGSIAGSIAGVDWLIENNPKILYGLLAGAFLSLLVWAYRGD